MNGRQPHLYIEVAEDLGIISQETATQARLAKDYPSLMHPGRAERLGPVCNRATTLFAVGAREHVVTDLTPWGVRKMPETIFWWVFTLASAFAFYFTYRKVESWVHKWVKNRKAGKLNFPPRTINNVLNPSGNGHSDLSSIRPTFRPFWL